MARTKGSTPPAKVDEIAKNMANGMAPREAAAVAGCKPVVGNNLLYYSPPDFTRKLHEELQLAGITPAYAAGGLKAGMEAMRVISAIPLKDSIEFGEASGRTHDFIEVEDWGTRLKYHELALKYLAVTDAKGLAVNLSVAIDNRVDRTTSLKMAIADLISAGWMQRENGRYVLIKEE